MQTVPPEIRIVIADDHPIVRQGLRTEIERQRHLKVVAEAANGRIALERIQAMAPDIAVVDISMPELDGLQLAAEVARLGLGVRIIFLTVHCDAALFERALEAGVRGYILKDTAMTEIVDGIQRVAQGQSYASPAMAGYLIEQRRRAVRAPRGLAGTLTATEKQVLRLIAEYKTSSEVGEVLHISPRTVDTHRNNICAKLELRGKHALMKFAIAHRGELE
jgi:DNA-binding NarL/FixJ family response regulator